VLDEGRCAGRPGSEEKERFFRDQLIERQGAGNI
jgi:hypothetical protein